MKLKYWKIESNICHPKGEPIRVIILGAGGRDFHNFEIDLTPAIEWLANGAPRAKPVVPH